MSTVLIEHGIIPVFMSDLCRYAIGEINLENKRFINKYG